MTTLVKRKLQSLSISWLCTRLIFFVVVVVGWYILVDYEVPLPKSHDSSPIKGTLCPVLKFCVSSIFPRDAIHRSQPLLALLQHLQGLKNKTSSSLGVSSTIYVLRWSYSFGSLFLVFWWCRVPNSLAIFPPEIYLRRPHNQNTQNRLYFWTHDCHFFNNVTPFYFKYIYFSDPKVFCLGLIQSLFEGSMYSFVLEWTPALTTGKATYNYRFFMFLSTVKINALYWSVYVFNMKILIEDNVSTPVTGERIAMHFP